MPPTADHTVAAAPSERQLHLLAVALAALAGFVDAAGFLKLGGTFVSFMSGNSTKLGVGIAHIRGATAITGLVVGSFVAGAMAGSLLSAAAPVRRKPLVLLVVSLGLCAGALSQMAGWSLPAVVAMAASMGAANTVFTADDGPYSVGVTYMTGNLVKLAEGLAGALLGRRRAWLAYLLLWLGLVFGAAGGALTYRAIGMNALWVAAAGAALLALAGRNVRSPPIGDSPES